MTYIEQSPRFLPNHRGPN